MPSDSIYFEVGQGLRADTGAWYQCVQLLGVGGNAVTYLVVCSEGPFRGALFALKIFRKLSNPERRMAFMKESAFLKTSQHPNVMRVFDTGVYLRPQQGTRHEHPFTVVEYMPTTLAEVIAGRTATMAERVSYAWQLLSALTYLARLTPPIVHRDIKPQNIFVKGRTCVLGDFGLLKALDGTDETGRAVLKESGGAGMPFFYRTPDLVEYALNRAQISSKSDVFQLGLVLAELFTGNNPCEPAEDILAPVVLMPVGTVPGDLGAGISALIRRMLESDPAIRPEAAALMGGWSGVFSEAVALATKINGKAF